MFLNTSMSIECSILNISVLGLHAQSVSFCTDFTIHKLSSLLFISQVYFFKYGLKSFCPLELKGVDRQQKEVTHLNTNPLSAKCLMHSQQLPHVLCGAGVLAVKDRLHRALSLFSARWLCHTDEA